MSTYAIGDIQGCYDQLEALLRKIEFSELDDTLWLVGDLINRGPKNVETLRFIMSLSNIVAVLGNHDLHFLAVATGVEQPGRRDTLSDLLGASDLPIFVDWLRHLPLVHLDEALGFAMIHAGQPPIWTLLECRAHAREVEAVLASDDYARFFTIMYGNHPETWHPDLEGADRLRVITNYLTRLRYCTADGKMELTHKANVNPVGYEPWFAFPRKGGCDYRLLFGHWASIEGQTRNPAIIGLDTGCVWGRTLTAMRLEDGEFFSVPGYIK